MLNQDPQAKPPLNKKNAPNFFFVFIVIALLALFVQSLFHKEKSNVAFAYQLEHLVNLDLLQPRESKKVVLSDQLTTFSGHFRQEQTAEGKRKYQYLEKLAQHNALQIERNHFWEQHDTFKKDVIIAGKWFVKISGPEIVPQSGFVIAGWDYDTPERENHIVIDEVTPQKVISVSDLQERLRKLDRNSSQQVQKLREDTERVLGYFLSPLLSILDEPIKQKLETVRTTLNNQETSLLEIQAQECEKAILTLTKVANALYEENLKQVQSVQRYDQLLEKDRNFLNQLEQNREQREKFYKLNDIWFFNDQEISSRLLEKQDSEVFNRWYKQAKLEWNSFQSNADTSFIVPNQPLNTILEKKFRTEEASPNYWSYLLTPLPIILFILFLYFIFSKQVKGMSGGPMGFGRSPAKMVSKEENKIRFTDVAGIEEAKEELQEIVDFLRNPQKFTALGARIPKGVICVGPPGTGKTLLAKAVAGEAHCPFFTISGSDFVEMFVGVGASRVRNLFDQAKKNSPCIIFIDEIDAVGRHRGAGMGGGHDEREQTLNQLLVEMDGFDSKEGIILMAATNRPDVLDKALLRPGRFDRRVVVDLPDIKGRYEILKVHAKKIKLHEKIDLMKIAQGTPGVSGADLENILNEAALLAARQEKKEVSQSQIKEASEKVRLGKERRSLQIDEEDKRATAYHEAGHAIVGYFKSFDLLDKVTIIPRGSALGITYFLPKKNRLGYRKKEVQGWLCMIVGARCAEELFLGEGEESSGAQNDIHQASELARKMVCEWGMSARIGLIDYSSHEGEKTACSDGIANAIDEEVHSLIAEACREAKSILKQYQRELEVMVAALLEFETLDSDDIKSIMDHTWNSEKKRKELMLDQEHLQKDQDKLKEETSTACPPNQSTPVIEVVTKRGPSRNNTWRMLIALSVSLVLRQI